MSGEDHWDRPDSTFSDLVHCVPHFDGLISDAPVDFEWTVVETES